MAKFMDEKTRTEVQRILKEAVSRPVRLVFFGQRHACGACAEQQELLQIIASLSDRISLEIRDFEKDARTAAEMRIDKIPATAVIGERDFGIRFYGLTGGYEFTSLLEAIVMVGSGRSGLEAELEALARLLRRPVHLEVMVTLTCPYCPGMVHLAHQLAFINENVRADMVDAAEFPTLVQRYHVHGVPRTVINGRPAFEGALQAGPAILEILKETDPEEYRRLEAGLRTARGERKVEHVEPGTLYDVLIVGAGPAGLCAALYAARKGRKVALLGVQAGGQINDTETIENWLGHRSIGGRELADGFLRHVESYPLAEKLHAEVVEVRRADDRFEAVTKNGEVFAGRAMIWAAGKRYRTLGVPGEERFLGRGIAFCATCDAPLFSGKQVAVVGGGNSALTAVRDLARFASRIHLIQNLPRLTADAALIEEADRISHLERHMGMQVRQFLGDEQLSGVRLASSDGHKRYDLAVDGVFLEIGLVPNTAPLKSLLALNDQQEIPVRRDGSTEVAGLFAAGDCTDEPEKQIVVAAGDGARAALAADRFLSAAKRA
jgi:alkyl hydroperoxide reductase subunit F